MDFLSEELTGYIEKHTQEEPEALYELNRQTNLKVLNPRMLAGHLQGRVLAMLSHMIRPKNVLEVGTYTGYSAICFAEGLQQGGQIHTIDINEELKDIQDEYFEKTGTKHLMRRHIGNALDIIPGLDLEFDLVYIDADKGNYWNYFELSIPKVPSGSYIVADNVLWSGKVLDENDQDADTRAIVEFNKKVQQDNRVQNVLFPIRDGLMVCRKV